MAPDDLPYRLASKITVDPITGCWIWEGQRRHRYGGDGYGVSRWHYQHWYVHRLVYTLLKGAIADGLTLDHLCGEKPCCNPAHMEQVTIQENIRRFARPSSHCKRGHDLTLPNARLPSRGCRVCERQRSRERYRREWRPGPRGRPGKGQGNLF